MAGFTMMAICV